MAPPPDAGKLCDHSLLAGSTWSDLGAPDGVEEVTTVAVLGDDVLLGTDDGLWRRPLDGSTAWLRAGLRGLFVNTILTIQGDAQHVFVGGLADGEGVTLPFHRSDDGGKSWTASGSEFRDDILEENIPVEHLALQPGDEAGGIGILYANMSGDSVARSTDGGATWEYVVGEPSIYGNYPCLLHIPAGAPHLMYQGCEAPLDDAWVDLRDISNPGENPSEPERLVGLEEIENRRPNSFASHPDEADRVYVGLEGALIWIENEGKRWDFVFRHDESSTWEVYTYVEAIWIDPCAPDHLVFGGQVNGENEVFSLYETFDNGATLDWADPPDDVGNDPRIIAGAVGGQGEDFVILMDEAAASTREPRVVVRHAFFQAR